MHYASLIGWGSYLPEKIITNDDLSKILDTSDEWIQKRTGIKQRHIAAENELTSDLGSIAALNAIQCSGLDVNDIDMLVVATTTPDITFPSTASIIQRKIGAKNAFAFDVQAVCAGFVYGMSVVDQFIRTGQAKNALLIGSETMSRILDWNDRTTAVLFGDGAGAFVFQQSKEPGLLGTKLYNDGCFVDALKTTGVTGQGKDPGVIYMNGREVYIHGIEKMGSALTNLCQTLNQDLADIDWFIPHQANRRMIESLAERFSLPLDKFIISVHDHANTSAATIPLAFCSGINQGLIKKGQKIAFSAMGGGFSWGSALLIL